MKKTEKLTMSRNAFSPIVYFLNSEIDPNSVSKLGITRAAIDRMQEASKRKFTGHGEGVYSVNNPVIKGVKYSKVSYKVTLTRNGYSVNWIKISGDNEKPGNRYNFPGENANKDKIEVLVDY
ncbi:MAG: hypothetical protein E7310_01450 [Clostridiales bacterium]|nr:hypothetical protein [Clostridiales bacterium]